jgi:hypothetical protein
MFAFHVVRFAYVHVAHTQGSQAATLIDEAFADQIDIVENGEARRVSVFEAIFMQLWFKEISGDKRARATEVSGIRRQAEWRRRRRIHYQT